MTDPPPAPPRWRLFVAAPVPPDSEAKIWSALAPLRALYPQARWAKRGQLHVTLLFLGQTDPDEVGRLEEAMALTAAQHSPFAATTSDAGGRVNVRRDGVAWLRLADRSRTFRNLARELDWRLGTNIYATSRPRPHVTVARRVDQTLLEDLRAVADGPMVTFTIDRIALYRSHAEPGGSRYEALAEHLLTGVPGGT